MQKKKKQTSAKYHIMNFKVLTEERQVIMKRVKQLAKGNFTAYAKAATMGYTPKKGELESARAYHKK